MLIINGPIAKSGHIRELWTAKRTRFEMGCGQIYLGKLESAILAQVPFYLGKSKADTKKEIKIFLPGNVLIPLTV